MSTFRCLAITLLILALPAVAAADSHDALMKEVADIGDALTVAMLEEDVDTMMAMYVDDAISLPNGSPRMDGVEEFKQQHAQMKAAGMKIHSFESDPTEVWEAGDHVIEIGTYEISLEMPGAGKMDDKGKYMTVYVRQPDGSLKIKAETWNTDMNPMMMGQAGAGEHEHEHEQEHGHEHEHDEHEG